MQIIISVSYFVIVEAEVELLLRSVEVDGITISASSQGGGILNKFGLKFECCSLAVFFLNEVSNSDAEDSNCREVYSLS